MPGIPICVYKPDMRMFLVTMYRGKIFFSGGFGVTRPCAVVAHDASNTRALRPTKDRDDEETSDDETKTNEQARRDVDSKNKNGEDCEDDAVQEASPNGADETTVELTTTNGSDSVGDGGREDGEGVRENVYLFLEEALYLHERGLLQVLDETGDEPMNSPRLFSMLEVHGIDLASYLTYAHLRTQTFVVLRHRDPKVVVDETDDDETKERPDADALAEAESRATTTTTRPPSPTPFVGLLRAAPARAASVRRRRPLANVPAARLRRVRAQPRLSTVRSRPAGSPRVDRVARSAVLRGYDPTRDGGERAGPFADRYCFGLGNGDHVQRDERRRASDRVTTRHTWRGVRKWRRRSDRDRSAP